MRRFLARQDVEQLFLRAKCGDLSLEKLTSVCATMGNDEDMGVVRQLFEELDVNEDGVQTGPAERSYARRLGCAQGLAAQLESERLDKNASHGHCY